MTLRAGVAAALLTSLVGMLAPTPSYAVGSAVLERRVIGTSVQGRPLVAWHLGEPGTRTNAHGVDLNRNFPFGWVDLDGNYESGPRPGSEPETRAVMDFLREIRPARVLSFHQPLLGVDTDTKDVGFARRLARTLHLPTRTLDCGGVCHGTMTGWFNHTFRGSALTVEYGAHPPRHRMRVAAPRQVIELLGGGWHDWLSADRAPVSGRPGASFPPDRKVAPARREVSARSAGS